MSSFDSLILTRGLGVRDGSLANVKVPLSMVGDAPGFAGIRDGDCLTGDLVLRDGLIAGMVPPSPENFAGSDLRLVTLPLVEPHCHLDKAYTGSRLGFIGGSLLEAIEAQERDTANWTADDLKSRAERALQELYRSGCETVRTHVNWTVDMADPARAPLAWDVFGELAEAWRGRIALQRSALISPEDLLDETVVAKVGARIAQDHGGVLGAFVLDHAERRLPIRNIVAAATRFDLLLDFHVDEGLSDNLDGVELIADAVQAFGYEGTALCGHVCSLAQLDEEARERRIARLAEVDLCVVALPVTNLYLQDRGRGTPHLRGITCLKELTAGGVTVSVGTDNVRDAFCPVGRHDPLRSLGQALVTAHLDPPLGRWLPLVAQQASTCLGLSTGGLFGLPEERCLIWSNADFGELMSR